MIIVEMADFQLMLTTMMPMMMRIKIKMIKTQMTKMRMMMLLLKSCNDYHNKPLLLLPVLMMIIMITMMTGSITIAMRRMSRIIMFIIKLERGKDTVGCEEEKEEETDDVDVGFNYDKGNYAEKKRELEEMAKEYNLIAVF